VRYKSYHSRFDLGADATCKQRGLVNLSAKCKSLAIAFLVSVHQNPLINIEAAPGDENINEEFEEANIEAGGTAAPQCVADEGENIPFIVEQLQDE
jgi:hypothetical protein